MSDVPPEQGDFPLHTIGFYTGVASVLLALTQIFNILPLPFIRRLGTLAGLSLILGLVAVAMGFVAQGRVAEPDERALARNAIVAGAAGVLLFFGLFVLGVVIGPFFT
jgi:hypothetical protein